MSAPGVFDYALIRVVPHVERGEFLNVGVVLFSRAHRYLAARIELDRRRLLALAPDIDIESVERYLEHIPRICKGASDAGPIAALSQAERFHWLVAPASAMIQPSPAHSGLSLDLEATLEHLMATMVRPPKKPKSPRAPKPTPAPTLTPTTIPTSTPTPKAPARPRRRSTRAKENTAPPTPDATATAL